MNTKEKRIVSSKFVNLAKVTFCIANFLLFCFLVIGESVYPDERDVSGTDCRLFESEWYQVLENEERVPVEVPGKIEAEYEEVITLVTTLPDEIQSGENICFRPIWQDVAVYVDGQLRVDYSTKESRPFGTNSAFRYVFLEMTEDDEGKELTYVFSSDSKYTGTMRACYIGEKSSIWAHLISENAARTIVAVFLFLFSLFCIIVCIILKWGYKINLALNHLAWTIFFCSLWLISEIEFRQLFVSNISILTSSTYWTLMLIPFPLLVYINEIQQRRYEKVFIGPIIYSAIVLVGGTILQIFDIVQFVEQLPFIHAGDAIAIGCVIVTLTIDTFRGRIKDYLFVGIGIYGMIVTAILEIILYYVDTGISLGTVLAIGLVFLLIMAIIKTGQDLFVTEKNRQQAIAAKESQAKFLANMSHEIRTPINAVIGMNEMILRESENEAVLEYARNIESASNMLLGLVNDILDFSKIESGQLEVIEDTYQFAPLIQDEILLLNGRVSGKPISTKIEIDPNLPSKFYGDELRIKQVLTNLLSNAVKYTHQGTVTLKVFFKWMDSDTVELCLSVIDTGVGIKKEDLPQLFDSFKRFELDLNRNIEGTGLGLNIVKQLVELMKGRVIVESEYGKGSNFTVCIPQRVMDKQPIGSLEEAMHERKKEKNTSDDFFTAPDAHVLVVDDNPMNLSLMKSLLKRTKMKVELAAGGRECLELTKQNTYDLILMDHMMPELDGIETLRMIRSDVLNVNRKARIVALTANAIAGSREMYLEYGFDDYLSKPIQADKLDEMLRRNLFSDEVKSGAEASKKNVEVPDELISIDKETGLSYCMDMEDLYADMLVAFCEQCAEYLPKLEEHFNNRDWKQYAIIAHALKGNALNIGAVNFSKLSLEHELAGKEENAPFITAEYAKYISALKKLVENIQKEAQPFLS